MAKRTEKRASERIVQNAIVILTGTRLMGWFLPIILSLAVLLARLKSSPTQVNGKLGYSTQVTNFGSPHHPMKRPHELR